MPEDKITYGEGATPIREEPESEKTDEHATNKDITIPAHTSADREITVSDLPYPREEVTELEVDRTRDKIRNRVKYSVTGRTYADTIHEFLKGLKENWFVIVSLIIVIVFVASGNLKNMSDVLRMFICISLFGFFRFVLGWK